MHENELLPQYDRMMDEAKEGARPIGAEYCPAEKRFEWLMEDGARQPMDLYDGDGPADMQKALDRLKSFCVAKGHPEFQYRITPPPESP